MDKNTFVDAASLIGHNLCRSAVWNEKMCNWIGMQYVEGAESSNFTSLKARGPDLYTGSCGIALFLGYLNKYAEEDIFRRTAKGAISHSIQHLNKIPEQLRFGFHSGHVGVAFVAARLGVLLNDDLLIAKSAEIIRDLSREVKRPHYLDVLSGNAGAIAPLIQIHKLTGSKEPVELAEVLTNELVVNATRTERGLSWNHKYSGTEPAAHDLTGFSHGAAGMAYAFLEYYGYTKEAIYRQHAEEAIGYENSWFNEQKGNWPDFRGNSTIGNKDGLASWPYASAWCHGAPGIGLTRLLAYSLIDKDKYLGNCLAAVEDSKKILIQSNVADKDFSLCHGVGGVSETLLFASTVLDNADLESLVNHAASLGIQKYASSKFWHCGIELNEVPDLMLGISGIGYFFLRLYDRPNVPSILLVTDCMDCA